MTALTIAECAAKWTEAEVSQSHSEACRWDCAPTALASSGTARAQQMADALRVNVTTVHNLAKAEQMYQYLRGWNLYIADALRKRHSYIRFGAMWRKHQKYEIDPFDCIEFINSDLSDTAMEMQIEDMYNPLDEWQRDATGKGFMNVLNKMANPVDSTVPAKVQRAARLFKGRIEEAG